MSTRIDNPEFFFIGGSKDVTVSITFIHEGDDKLAMLNAAEALKHYYDRGELKSWLKRIEVKHV